MVSAPAVPVRLGSSSSVPVMIAMILPPESATEFAATRADEAPYRGTEISSRNLHPPIPWVTYPVGLPRNFAVIDVSARSRYRDQPALLHDPFVFGMDGGLQRWPEGPINRNRRPRNNDGVGLYAAAGGRALLRASAARAGIVPGQVRSTTHCLGRPSRPFWLSFLQTISTAKARKVAFSMSCIRSRHRRRTCASARQVEMRALWP